MVQKFELFFNNVSRHKSIILTIIMFVLVFALGVSFISKLNVNFDTTLEHRILRSNIKNYSRVFGLNKLINYYDNLSVPLISEDIEKDHGISAYYLFAPFLLLNNISSSYTIYMWYFYTFIIFFVGVIYFYRLVYYLFKSRKISIISSLLYVSCPRIFVDGIHNNKDIVLMSLLVLMIFYGLKVINEKKKKDVVLFALFSGLVCNTKIIGLFFLCVIGIGYIINLFIKNEWSKKNIIYGIFAFLLALIFYILLTPAIWGNGKLEIIDFIRYCFKNSVSFRADPKVLFEGTIFKNSANPLPNYYIPKMMSITIPIVSLVLFIFGLLSLIVKTLKNIFDKKIDSLNVSLLCIFVMFLVPLIIAIVSHPVLYNGWRHFYFLYSLLMIISSYGIYIFSKKWDFAIKYINLVCILTIIINFCYLLKYDVANTAYYNLFINRKNIEKRYELDYYEVTSKQAISSFIKSYKLKSNDGVYYIYGDGFNSRILSDLFILIGFDQADKFQIVNDEQYKKLLDSGNVIYVFNNPIYSDKKFNKKKKVYSYKIFKSNIVDFYEMKKDNV